MIRIICNYPIHVCLILIASIVLLKHSQQPLLVGRSFEKRCCKQCSLVSTQFLFYICAAHVPLHKPCCQRDIGTMIILTLFGNQQQSYLAAYSQIIMDGFTVLLTHLDTETCLVPLHNHSMLQLLLHMFLFGVVTYVSV